MFQICLKLGALLGAGSYFQYIEQNSVDTNLLRNAAACYLVTFSFLYVCVCVVRLKNKYLNQGTCYDWMQQSLKTDSSLTDSNAATHDGSANSCPQNSAFC